MAPRETQGDDEQLLDRLDRLDRVSAVLAAVPPDALGHRIKRLRESQGLSIREIAERAGLSKNSIVRLEQGRGSQPVTVLKVCAVLGVHVDRLVRGDSAGEAAAVHTRDDDRWFDGADMGSGPLLGRAGPLPPRERSRAVARGARIPVNLLQSRLEGGRVLPSLLEVHAASPTRSHVGEEFVYVLEGTLVLSIGSVQHRLRAGESIAFWSAEPHSYAPAKGTRRPVRILSVRIDG
ncbi:MAG: helix-turn-helix domain-containing protein [Planctomycetota bacterium]